MEWLNESVTARVWAIGLPWWFVLAIIFRRRLYRAIRRWAGSVRERWIEAAEVRREKKTRIGASVDLIAFQRAKNAVMICEPPASASP